MNAFQKEFLAYYEKEHDAFVRFCHAKAYGLMEAEDLVSESVLAALENFNTLEKKEAFRSYLFSIAMNVLNKKNRRLKFRGKYYETKVFEIKDEGISAEDRMDIGILYDALNELPAKQKDALILFEISGFSIKEIAKTQKEKESTIKQRLKRGREKLATILKCEALTKERTDIKSSVLMTVFL